MPPAERIAEPWGPRMPYDRGAGWRVRVDRHGAGDDEADRLTRPLVREAGVRGQR